ncbi:MAG: MASE3 domain-containing protein, partial [Deltaproteobacteria bacterium]
MTPQNLHRMKARHVIAAALVFFGLYLASRWNFLLFHGIAEIFSVSVAGTIFMVSWNTRRQLEDAYFSFLGIGLLFVALLDLLHFLAYKGMGVFPGAGANLPTQLWIANRYVFAISFLAAPWFAGRRLHHEIAIAAYAAATACLLATIFAWKIFPDCFIEGVGLTPFKIASEYVISGIFLSSIVFLMRKKEHFESQVLQLLVIAAGIAVASEMAFTLYTDVYGHSNLIGHFLEILSFFLIYQAVIGTDLVRKYELNRRLQEELTERQRAQEEVRKAKERLEERVAQRTVELSNLARRLQDELESRQKAEEGLARQTDLLESVLDSVGDGVVVADTEGKFLVFNPEAERILHLGAIDTDKDQWARRYGIYLPDEETLCPTEQLPIVRAIRGESFNELELYVRHGPGPEGVWVSCSARPLLRRDGQVQGGVVAFRDISARKRGEKALRDSTELLEKVFSNIHLSVVNLDRDFRFLRVNQAYADASGHPPEFFTGKNHFDLYPHEENEAIFRKVVETGEPFNVYAKPFILPDRPERGVTYWDWSLLPLKEPGGKVNGLIFCLVDVTDRRQAEMELRALNRTLGEVSDTLRSVIQASPLPILLLDSEGKVKIWNPAAERVFGWSLHEVLGRFLPIVPEDRKEEFLDILVRSRQGESFSNLEVHRVRKDGSRLDVLVSTAPLRDPEGTYLGNIAMLVDITDRKRIENALRESEERFRDLVEQSPVGICIVQEGRIVFRNPEQRRLFGPMPENLELREFQDIHPEDAAKFGKLCSAVATGGSRTQEMDLRFYPYGKAHDGVDMRWVHVITGPMEYRGKEAALVIMSDITRLKEMEFQFLVREKMASLGHVAAGIAHEIRN